MQPFMYAIYRHNIHLKDRIHGYRLQRIKTPHLSENPEPHDQADDHEQAQNNNYLSFRTFFHTLVIKFVFSSQSLYKGLNSHSQNQQGFNASAPFSTLQY
jgi:hypothetical protein